MTRKTRITIVATVFALVTISTFVLAQNRDKEKEITDIKKEVKIEIINGEKTVTITTTKDGEESTEILTGEKAEKYISEHEMHSSGHSEINKKIIMDLDDDFDFEKMIDLSDFEGLSEEIQNKIEKIISEIDINTKDGNFSLSIDDEENKGKVMVKIISHSDGETDKIIEDFDIDISISDDSTSSETKKTVIKKVIVVEEEDDK